MSELGHAASVRFENVEKSFGPVKVLVDFDLEVEPGEFARCVVELERLP